MESKWWSFVHRASGGLGVAKGIQWNPDLHPRDLLGRFRKKLSSASS